ncbi:XRE family transcriptional regulator [Streptomyces sp. 15-116A]|uniref:helix-turn-helix domain-containing protein n=1 Tax=Streptomyces sp. 15-116A TaxID=2259035 RepID=UPI0021B4511E|nr:XRE family transcriptional regulator [Streptomyces sp. 15-116A]MCT7353334.1 XRE family transcriptional regulator [Streptomyces sp. 15-116A]
MTPSPERTQLAFALRELKQRAGLSLTGLEERTPFSKSSWGRYLKGETLPPREAVRELCRLAGEPDGHCLALWELAEAETSGRAAPPQTEQPPPEPSSEPGPPSKPPPPPAPAAPPHKPTRHGSWRIAAVTAAALTAVLTLTATAALLLTGSGSPESEPETTGIPTSPPAPRCRDTSCEARDPMNMRCGSGTHTLATHRTATGARLELRHNPRCGASWARMWSTEVGDRLEMTASGPTHATEVVDALDARNYLYTPMTATDPGTLVRACFRPAHRSPRECFEATVR